MIFGTLTNKIDLPDECLNRSVEFEKAIDDYIDKGIDNIEITFDESFYTFDTRQLANIKETVKQKKLGVKQYRKCCGKETSSISFETVEAISEEIKNSGTLQEKVNTYTKAVDNLIKESTANVKDLDKNSAAGEFLFEFITSLQIALTKLVLSPKNLLLLNMFYYLLNSEPVKELSIKKILKVFECVIRDIISELIRKLIYEYLLPMVIKALTNLIICVITKKLKEKNLYNKLSRLSLLPGFVNQQLESVNELFGKAEGVVDAARGFTDKVNLDSLNNVNLSFNKKGRFCDT